MWIIHFFTAIDGRLYPMYYYNGAYMGMTQGDNLANYEPGEENIFNCLSRPES